MKPTELDMFSAAEQTLLVHTERQRLAKMSEDELDELFTRVRRARTKYTKLYRRQSADLVASKSSRAGTSTSNQRTKRKAEILEDAAGAGRHRAQQGRAGDSKGTQGRASRCSSCGKGLPAQARRRQHLEPVDGDGRRQGRAGSIDDEGAPGVPEVVGCSNSGQERQSLNRQAPFTVDSAAGVGEPTQVNSWRRPRRRPAHSRCHRLRESSPFRGSWTRPTTTRRSNRTSCWLPRVIRNCRRTPRWRPPR